MELFDFSDAFDKDDESGPNPVLSALKKLGLLGQDLSRQIIIHALLDSKKMQHAKLLQNEAIALCATFGIDWDEMRERKNRQITNDLPPARQKAIAFLAALHDEVSDLINERITGVKGRTDNN